MNKDETIKPEISRGESSVFSRVQDKTLRRWTINFDLDTTNPSYDRSYYPMIHKFLKDYDFEYRQHSGDISTREMTSYDVIAALNALYNKYPQIKACTKSCLFTSVDENYSFTDVRKQQLNTKPKKSKFSMHLEIKESDAKSIFNTTNPELLEGYIRNSFKSPPDLKEHMSYKAAKKSDGSISIDWTSSMAISSLDKTIATNHIFAKYPKLLEDQRNVILEMKYGKNKTSLIADQRNIASEEKKRLVEYDMSTKVLGKREYDNRNEMLKRRLAYFGLKPIQESGWISENGMTDEQIQAVLTELFRENCNYDKIAQVMDISVISSEIYDYMKLSEEQGASSGANSGQNTSIVRKNAARSSETDSESVRATRERPIPFEEYLTSDDSMSDDDEFQV